jgi:hypothetical protein
VKSNTSFARQRRAEPVSGTIVRAATALLITFAAALVLIHAQAYGGGLPQPEPSIWTSVAANTADPH